MQQIEKGEMIVPERGPVPGFGSVEQPLKTKTKELEHADKLVNKTVEAGNAQAVSTEVPTAEQNSLVEEDHKRKLQDVVNLANNSNKAKHVDEELAALIGLIEAGDGNIIDLMPKLFPGAIDPEEKK